MPSNPGYPPGYVSQRKAVALALDALGDAAPNADLVRWVRDHHGHDVAKYISQFKTAARKRRAAAGKPPGKPGRPPKAKAPAPPPAAPPEPVAPPAAARPVPPAGGLADDLTALARLAAKYGAGEVRGMLGALEAAAAAAR